MPCRVLRRLSDGFRDGEFSDYTNVQQIPLSVSYVAEFRAEVFNYPLTETFGNNRKPVLFDTLHVVEHPASLSHRGCRQNQAPDCEQHRSISCGEE